MSHKETCTGLYKKSVESFKQKMMHVQMLKRTPFDVWEILEQPRPEAGNSFRESTGENQSLK